MVTLSLMLMIRLKQLSKYLLEIMTHVVVPTSIRMIASGKSTLRKILKLLINYTVQHVSVIRLGYKDTEFIKRIAQAI